MTGHTLPLPLLLSVSDVTRLIRDSLEAQFRDIWIEGEITNLRAPSSGHLYFTLKDEQSQLRGVLFRSGALRLRFALQEGLTIVARGRKGGSPIAVAIIHALLLLSTEAGS